MVRIAKLLILLTTSLWLATGLARAQDIIVVSVSRQAPTVVVPEPLYLGQPVDVAAVAPPTALNRAGLACYTNQNSPQCSNLRRDLLFIFGSCRYFFGEPCLPHPNSTGVGLLGVRSGQGLGSTFGTHR